MQSEAFRGKALPEQEKRAIERAFMAEIGSETKDYPLTRHGSEHGVLRQRSKLEGGDSAATGEGRVVGGRCGSA